LYPAYRSEEGRRNFQPSLLLSSRKPAYQGTERNTVVRKRYGSAEPGSQVTTYSFTTGRAVGVCTKIAGWGRVYAVASRPWHLRVADLFTGALREVCLSEKEGRRSQDTVLNLQLFHRQCSRCLYQAYRSEEGRRSFQPSLLPLSRKLVCRGTERFRVRYKKHNSRCQGRVLPAMTYSFATR
jgi:hypothetical protein